MNVAAEGLEVLFDRQVYALEIVQKAAYRLVDRAAVSFDLTPTHVRCVLLVDTGNAVDEVARDFHKEVLDQQLRAKIASETESIRHLILAHAFSRTGLT
ncbi:His-Xaa-Ser system protein HxsD [Paraburkholderia caballeronis]|uniref:His-Xaa-Ser system protein HxsD n=1 Tax=Paraburkholderia caballeronis TaxID=416943 RepID=A0A1H7MVH0_9BURK|nr:His-Xaa-Ser system protein HxsD [Paraburkholderia caballeronis]PXW26423.1 His-Xaa-Ser system protein HxsD [Paraburkholderia caballeronis]PXX01970.1 His-Xaa-Ser system protein HxsD [Paraburkholderia caballeronis]RAK01127.1 His-Xaa-Ser system protein HxsD [Paraburkholderia caballeronis]SEB96488.1 His-Xaa-Ser system protein HxsD [Paraburkholderia caballeronis]SEL14597.1 His-Xaa-Ser system protein HxsD [Paraburkholderia caballeronis]